MNGMLQLMSSHLDTEPLIIDSLLHVAAIAWSPDGSVLLVVGITKLSNCGENEFLAAKFYSRTGCLLHHMKIPNAQNAAGEARQKADLCSVANLCALPTCPGSSGSSLREFLAGVTWHGTGTKVAIATDHVLYILHVRPCYQWAACSDTLVYTYNVPNPHAHDERIMFWNTRTDERCPKSSKPVIGLSGCGSYCLLVTSADQLGQYSLIVCNTMGSPVDSRTIQFEPIHIQLTTSHAIVCSADLVYVWQFLSHEVCACLQLWCCYCKNAERHIRVLICLASLVTTNYLCRGS
jgi:WD repeat-containing protein 35